MAYPYRKQTFRKPASTPPVKATAPTFAPSEYQRAIMEWLANDSGSATIIATAGSGKTSTLCLLAFNLPTNASAIFLAFGKAIATELSTRLPFPASTFHSLGYSAVTNAIVARTGKRPTMDARKLDNIWDAHYTGDAYVKVRSAVLRLTGLCKNENTNGTPNDDTIMALIDHHSIEWDGDTSDVDVCQMVRTMLTASLADLSSFDFDDMLWFVERLDCTLRKYDYIMIDECQDTNALQRAILHRIMHASSRLVAVGDPAQAIYGFRGASHDAIERIASEFHTTELPLTVSYRCPVSVVQLAQEYGAIEAAPNARDGSVEYPSNPRLADFQPNELVLCRNTAPLVNVCYRLIAARIPAQIKGRDIGAGLIALVTKLAGKRGTLDTLADRIETHKASEMARAYARKQEQKAQSVADKCDSLLALLETLTPEDAERGIAGLTDVIASMFSDNPVRGAVLLSTIHKAKGLEAPRVTILDAHLMPSKYARQDWQLKQERCLQFVAITRSQDVLTFVDSKALTAE